MGSAAKQRGKEEWLLLFFITSISEQHRRKDFSTKKHSLRGRPENTEMEQTVIKKNVPTAQGKKSIQTLH